MEHGEQNGPFSQEEEANNGTGRHSPLIGRRKLLASIGMAGAAVAAGGLLQGGIAGPAFARGSSVAHSVYGSQECANLRRCIPSTIYELRADTAPRTDAVYVITDTGQEGHFIHDPLDTTSPDNTGTILVTYNGARFKRILESPFINVTWFGAQPDGSADATEPIQAADSVAAALSKSVYFPEGTYSAYGLQITTSWLADGQAVIENNSPTSYLYGFVQMANKDGLKLEGLTFDGGVSADPPQWTSSNYNAFTGGLACFLYNCDHILIVNCTFRNSLRSPLRIEKCSSVTVVQCTMRRGRGTFGDGVYVSGSDHIRFERCLSEDYTRIGFVSEQSSSHISYVDCYAKNGHDQSKLYGGTEYNAGYWAENSEHVRYTRCVAENNTQYGFTVTPGTNRPHLTETAPFVLESCIAINNRTGIYASDGVKNRYSVRCSGCSVFGSSIGIWVMPYHADDTVTLDHCHIQVVAAPGHNALGVQIIGDESTASVRISHCTFDREGVDPAFLASKTQISGDIILNLNSNIDLNVERCACANASTPVVLKVQNGTPAVNVSHCAIAVPVLADFREARFESCRFFSGTHSFGSASATGDLHFADCDIQGGMEIGTTGRIRFHDVRCRLTGSQNIGIARTVENKDILAQFTDCRFEKDVASSDYIVRIQEDGTIKPTALFHGCVFYNTNGTSTSTHSFIWVVRSGTPSLYANCYSDNTVSNLLKVDTTLSAPAGNTALDLQ